jgi:lipopolysaccharide heptosyltransferase II
MNKIALLKLIDGIAGRLLAALLPSASPARKSIPDKNIKILIIRPGGIGDAALLLPAIDALKNKFPDSEIHILCEKRNHEVFFLKRAVNKIYLYDKGLDILSCLRNKYDVAIDTEQWHRLSAAAAYFTHAAMRIGFATNERRRLFTHLINYSHDEYEVQSFFRLIEPLMGDISDIKAISPFIDIPNKFPGHLPSDSLKGYDKIIAISPGASVRERRWGGENFGAVARSLSDKGYKVLILGAKSDREDAEKIAAAAKGCIDLTGKTSLLEVASLLGTSKLFIGADSGIMHIAYAAGIPTVSLFGSGIEKKWAPRGKKHIVLNNHLPCSPCTKFGYTAECKRNIECLNGIGVEAVVRAAEILLTPS